MTIPTKELVGKNPLLAGELPIGGPYHGKHIYRYYDEYTRALNGFARVDEVFSNHREAIAKGENYPISNLIMDALGKKEGENHLADIVMTAARAGEWKAIERLPHQRYGLYLVIEKHFGHLTNYKGKMFLLPSALYVVYCKEKLDSLK